MHQSKEEHHVELVPGPSPHNNNNYDDNGIHRSMVPPSMMTPPGIMMYVFVVIAATLGYVVGMNNIHSANIGAGGDVINSSSYATANALDKTIEYSSNNNNNNNNKRNTTIITIPDKPPKYISYWGNVILVPITWMIYYRLRFIQTIVK